MCVCVCVNRTWNGVGNMAKNIKLILIKFEQPLEECSDKLHSCKIKAKPHFGFKVMSHCNSIQVHMN